MIVFYILRGSRRDCLVTKARSVRAQVFQMEESEPEPRGMFSPKTSKSPAVSKLHPDLMKTSKSLAVATDLKDDLPLETPGFSPLRRVVEPTPATQEQTVR